MSQRKHDRQNVMPPNEQLDYLIQAQIDLASRVRSLERSVETLEHELRKRSRVDLSDADLTRREVAELFGISVATVERWRQRGRFPGAYKLGQWHFPPSAIEHARNPPKLTTSRAHRRRRISQSRVNFVPQPRRDE